MTLPAFLFGSLISVLIGSVFHLIVGGKLKKYLSYLFFSWLGFWVGYYLSNRISFSIWRIGFLDVGYCILGSILTMLLIYWIDKDAEDTQDPKEED
ncbi:MAG: hypothetical protein C4545_08450 [Anaerolineaceae bacterium]|jgi:hypothetical protein|nr:MAG: hypothetical protein C4545_08450 [Anaerolineaceae bacterium]